MKIIDLKNENLIIDKEQNEPIIVVYNLQKHKDTLSFKVTIEKNIKASIIEVFLNAQDNKEYTFKREFTTKENSNLIYLKYQDVKSLSKLNFDFKFNLDENSNMQITNLELGNAQNINNYISILDSVNSNIEIAGLVKLNKKTLSESTFNIMHLANSCTSNIKYKHSLDASSKAVFKAKSVVKEKADFSKVHQNTDTILLSDDAVIFAQPHLEINIDELEASHGATAGSLDEEQLLYLQSRGIRKELAQTMLLKAFENEIYDNIQDTNIKDFVAKFKRNEYV